MPSQWPATVLKRNVTSQQVQLQYDNGSVEWTKAAFGERRPSPPDCGCDFGKEDFPIQDGEFVEESNDSPTDPCAWLGKVSRTIVSGQSYMVEYPFHDTIPEEIKGSLLRRARVFKDGVWMNVRPHFSWAPGRVTNPLDLDLISEDDLWVYIKEQLEANLQNMRAAMGVPLPIPTAPSPAPALGFTSAARPQPFPQQQQHHQQQQQQHQPSQLPTLNLQQASTSSQQQHTQPRLSIAAAAAAAGMMSARGTAPPLMSIAAAAAAAGRAGGASLSLGASPNAGRCADGGERADGGAQLNPQQQQPQRLQPQRLQPLQQAQPLQFPQQLLPQLRLNAGLSHAEVQRAKFAALGKLGNAAKARLAAAEEQRGAAAVAHTLTQIGVPGGLNQLNHQRANATLIKQRAHAAAMLRAAPQPRDDANGGGGAAADDAVGGGGGGAEGGESEEEREEREGCEEESDEEEAYAQPKHHGGGSSGKRPQLLGSDGAGGDPRSSTQGRYLQSRWFHEFKHLRRMTVHGEERVLCSCCTLYNGQTLIAPKGDSIRKHMRTARHLKADAAFP
ncbi:MAG: hypothetical protein WDW38_003843 [Sanguina aurantia]